MGTLRPSRFRSSTPSGRRPEVVDTLRGVVRPGIHALIAAVVGVVIALGTLQLDAFAGLQLPVMVANTRAVVAGLVTALVTIALFSIWMRSVVAGLASGQVSARIVAEYLDDDLQWELITGMSAAFTFTSTVLLHLPADDTAGVPAVSVILAVCTVILGLVMVMGALRSGVQGLAPTRLAASLAARARAAVHNDPAPDGTWAEDPWYGEPLPEVAASIGSEHTGWVRSIDHRAMLAVLPPHSRLGLHVDVGSFVADGDRLASGDAALSDDDLDTVRDAIELTDVRDPGDDVGFVLQQLGDLAQQAFGAAGDSSLAEEGLLHIRAILGQLIETGVPSGHAVGAEGRAVIALERRTVSDHLFNTLEPLVHASRQGSPIARRQVATTIRQLQRRLTADPGPGTSLTELLRLLDHGPATSGPATSGQAPAATSATGVVVLFTAQAVVAVLRRHGLLGGLVDNAPLLLMDSGGVLEENLAAARLTPADLRAKLREANVVDPARVHAVVFETTGDVSVLHGGDRFDPDLLRGVRRRLPDDGSATPERG